MKKFLERIEIKRNLRFSLGATLGVLFFTWRVSGTAIVVIILLSPLVVFFDLHWLLAALISTVFVYGIVSLWVFYINCRDSYDEAKEIEEKGYSSYRCYPEGMC